MSSPTKRPSFAIQSWSSDAQSAPRPSWMSRKRASSRPPPPAAEPAHREPERPSPEAVAEPAHEPAPSSVDLGLAAEIAALREENAGLHAQVAASAARMARLRREVLESSEPELVRLAVAVAERVVGRELALDPALVVSWARDAIQALAAKDEVVIAIARDVAQSVPSDAWSGIETKHKVQADPVLAPGSVEVRAAEGAIAAGGEARLEAVAQALGVGEP
jgi:flagellar biosynthesis/type III secretory pathway protein FliH